ncbi:MAG: hypothetical protein ACRC20_13455 [Segniliparus sp.]|uniref:hypothetical protein n=1 Tax=Segniliparus sp. TaxID=2804064 RepID=UPI003F335EBA
MIRQGALRVRAYFTKAPRRSLARRRLLALSSPLVALALMASGYLFWAYTSGRDAAERFDRQDVPGLHDKARSLLGFNEIEPWKAHLAEGDAYVLEGRLPDAEREFDQATALADPEEGCTARINLVVVLENIADELAKAGSLAEARAKIAKAQRTMREAPGGCFVPKPHPGVSDEDLRLFAEATARLGLKAEQLAHGDLHYDPQDSTYRYSSGTSTGKLAASPGPGPCPQTNDPEQTACIRNKDQPPPPPPSAAPDDQDPADQGPDTPPPESGGPPKGGAGQSGASPPDQGTAKGSIDDIGPDRLPAPGVGPVEHKLNPQSAGDPADKLKQAQADANGSGEDRE